MMGIPLGGGDIITVGLNAGQMVEDVRLAVNGKEDVSFYGRPAAQS